MISCNLYRHPRIDELPASPYIKGLRGGFIFVCLYQICRSFVQLDDENDTIKRLISEWVHFIFPSFDSIVEP